MNSSRIEKINQYYLSTFPDYQEFWMGEEDLAMHFGYYDSNTKTHQHSLEKMNEVLASLVGISSKDLVLDAGCGFGGSAIWLAENIGCQVKGINIVNDQLKIATQYASKRFLSKKIRFSNQDYSATSFPNAYFSVVWALESVIHTENKEAFFKEAFRLLNKGGRLIIAEYMISPNHLLSLSEKKQLSRLKRGWELANFLSIDHYQTLFNNNNFTDVQFYDLTENVMPSVKRLGDFCQAALPVAKAKLTNKTWNPIRYRNVVAGKSLSELFSRQTIRYLAITGYKL